MGRDGMALTDLFIRRPIMAVIVNVAILLAGGLAVTALPLREYPELKSATITIDTAYPGATQEVMQGFVTAPLSQAIATASGVSYVSSTSGQGSSQIRAKLDLNADATAAMADVLAKVQQVSSQLPEGATDPVVAKVTDGSSAVQYVAFVSDSISIPELTEYASRVALPLITAIPGVASARIQGGRAIAMRIWIDPDALAARGLSALDLRAALLQNNIQAAPGQLRGESTLVSINANTDLRSVEDFRAMVIKSDGQSVVRLGDVAEVELGGQNSDSSTLTDGRRSVTIAIYPTPDGNPLEIVEQVTDLIPRLQETAPPGMTVMNQFDVRHFVDAAISEVGQTLVEAIIIVIVVVYLFLGSFRSVIIPVITIPLSLVGTAALMYVCGFSINLLTLLAMVLAVGLVVDDAIVVMENIQRHRENGRSALDAALIGAREVVGPVVAMTITLAAVYAPIGLTGGLTGALFREFAFTLAGSVLVSGVIALTLSPMMSQRLIPGHENRGRFATVVDTWMRRLSDRYGSATRKILDQRVAVAIVGVGVMAAILLFMLRSERELAPNEDHGYVFALVRAPEYANLDYSEQYSKDLEGVFRSMPEYVSSWFDVGISGQNYAFGGIIVSDWDQRERSSAEIQADIAARASQITGTFAAIFEPAPLPGSSGGLPLQMVVRSPEDFSEIYATTEALKGAAWGSGLFAFVDSDLAFDTPAVAITIDRAKANQLGVRMKDIADTLAVMVGENYENRFNWRNQSYDVIVQVPADRRLNPGDLGNLHVATDTGAMVKLSTFVTFDARPQANRLRQFNQMNSATISAVLAPGVSMGDAIAFLQSQPLPAGTSIDWLSNSRQYVEEGNRLTIALILAIVVIFMVLGAQFESVRDPLVILVTVPLAISGALVPIYLGFATLNIYTQIGLVTLIGLISKHGILMVSFANQLQRELRLDRAEAITRAAIVRLRPIMMTTAAMVAGLVPLVLATGAGAASRFAIGIVMVTGMIVGTLFTLFVLPTVYAVFAGDHRPARAKEPESDPCLVEAVHA
jgi:multidrug efflux pump